jgi:coenzyme PQQ biosynthesis protein PqqD
MLDKKVTRDENVAWRIIGDEAVLLSAEDSSVHSLDAVGTRIWELCDGEKTVSEIVDQVVSEFEVDRETAEKDVVEFIEELMKKEKSLVSLS